MKCPKCNDGMNEGHIVDERYGPRGKSKWAKGKNLHGGFTLHLRWPWVRSMPNDEYYLTVYRCRSCGFLESYAVEEVP